MGQENISDQIDITIQPFVDKEGNASVYVKFGAAESKISMRSARKFASILNRAASDATYEGAITKMMRASKFTPKQIREAIANCRAIIEKAHIKQN